MKIEELITSGLKKRSPLLEAGLDCFRLLDGVGDGLPGMVVDKFGGTLVVHVYDGVAITGLSQLLRDSKVCREALGVCGSAALLRTRSSDPRVSAEHEGEVLYGSPQESSVVVEHGVKYQTKPRSQVNAGLFLDTRGVRAQLKGNSQGKKVVNTFCFTGSLGIAAAVGGADEVIQVDSAARILAWAKENWLLNQPCGLKGSRGTSGKTGLAKSPPQMRFIEEDAIAFLQREHRRIEKGGRAVDVLIVDPPVFGTSDKGRFVLERDLPELLIAGFRCLQWGGELYLTVNTPTVSITSLEGLARAAAVECKKAIEKVEKLFPPPEDFSAPLAQSQCMRGVKVRLVS